MTQAILWFIRIRKEKEKEKSGGAADSVKNKMGPFWARCVFGWVHH